MPSAYTYDVGEGTITDLPTFALRLARGMGPLVGMREESLDTPIPEQLKANKHYIEQLEDLRQEWDKLQTLTEDEWQTKIDKEYTEWETRRAKYIADNDLKLERYRAMIARVEAWKNAPEQMKSFALSQLGMSVTECLDNVRYAEKPPSRDSKIQREIQIEKLEKMIAYYEKEAAAEISRVARSNIWLKQLRDSLGL